MKKNNRSKRSKKILVAAGALACVTLLAGTYAWLQSTDTKTNKFTGALSGDDVTVTEQWEEPENWKPGQSVDKKVGIMNTGEYEEFIRVSFKEALALLADVNVVEDSTTPPEEVPAGYDPLDKDSTVTLPTGAGWLIPVNKTPDGWTEITTIQDSNGTAIPATSGYTLVAYKSADYTINDPNKPNTTITRADYKFYWKKDSKLYLAGGISNPKGVNATTVKLGADDKPTFPYISAVYGELMENDWTKPVVGQLYKPWEVTDANAKPVEGAYVNQDFAAPAAPWWTNSNIAYTNPSIPTQTKAQIAIDFVNMSENVPAAGSDTWYYNDADGYFYYLNVVDSGATTKNIIEHVRLEKGADDAYTRLRYNLDVKAEAIQAIGDAAKEEWGVTGDLGTLYSTIEVKQ